MTEECNGNSPTIGSSFGAPLALEAGVAVDHDPARAPRGRGALDRLHPGLDQVPVQPAHRAARHRRGKRLHRRSAGRQCRHGYAVPARRLRLHRVRREHPPVRAALPDRGVPGQRGPHHGGHDCRQRGAELRRRAGQAARRRGGHHRRAPPVWSGHRGQRVGHRAGNGVRSRPHGPRRLGGRRRPRGGDDRAGRPPPRPASQDSRRGPAPTPTSPSSR